MIFVDTNVIMYAVGRDHPLRPEARAFFADCLERGVPLVTSAEVQQELLHAYLAADRLATLDAALDLVRARIPTIWPIELEDVALPRFTMRVRCGKGTYIRSLARDIGRALNTHGTLIGLRRTRVGRFDEGRAVSLAGMAEEAEGDR